MRKFQLCSLDRNAITKLLVVTGPITKRPLVKRTYVCEKGEGHGLGLSLLVFVSFREVTLVERVWLCGFDYFRLESQRYYNRAGFVCLV